MSLRDLIRPRDGLLSRSNRITVRKNDESSFELFALIYEPTVDRQPFYAESIKPTDRYEIPVVIVKLPIIHRSLRSGVIIHSELPYDIAFNDTWDSLKSAQESDFSIPYRESPNRRRCRSLLQAGRLRAQRQTAGRQGLE